MSTACRDIEKLKPVARKACRLFIEECKKAGLNVCITETFRPQSRQDELWEQGRTKAGKIVTWTRKSRHTKRLAWDICKNVKGQEYSDIAFFEKCGAIAGRLGIVWGGTWKERDLPHFEVTDDWKWDDDEMIEKDFIIVDGKELKVDMIRKEGFTFVKTRDIADALDFKIDNQGRIPVFTKGRKGV